MYWYLIPIILSTIIIQISIYVKSLLFHFDHRNHRLLDCLILVLFAMMSQQSEIVSHYDIPLLQLIQHFDLLDFQSFIFVNIIVISELRIFLHFVHAIQFHILLLVANFMESSALILEVRILLDTDQRTPSFLKVFHHHLPKSIIRIKHLVIKYPIDSK